MTRPRTADGSAAPDEPGTGGHALAGVDAQARPGAVRAAGAATRGGSPRLPALLEATGLTASYGREVLHGVTLAVDAGRCLVVMGESGSGKSTLLRALLGVGVSVRGSIRLAGEDLLVPPASAGADAAAHPRPDAPVPSTRRPAARRPRWQGQVARPVLGRDGVAPEQDWRSVRGAGIGMVFQDPAASFSPVQRVGRQVLAVARTHRREPAAALRAEAARLMDLVGLPAWAWRSYPGELSGGMAARMALVCALLPRPQVLLMDEPTASVDAATRQAVVDVVRRACAGALDVSNPAMATVIVTHDLDLATALADDVLVLHSGRVVESGPAAQVLTSPRQEHTARLLEAFAALREGGDVLQDRVAECGGESAERPPARPSRTAAEDPADGNGGPLVPVAAASRAQAEHSHGETEGTQASGGVVLEVGEVRKDWGEGPVLDSLSLAVRAGEVVALTGPSGVGKTTLARVVAGLVEADAGVVLRPQEPGGVGLVFQSPDGQFNPRRRLWRSVAEGLLTHRRADERRGEQVAELAPGALAGDGLTGRLGRDLGAWRGRRVRREAARAAVAEVFTRCRLDPALMDSYPRQVSLGQLQRAAIARSVLSGARLLICDEVTSALDPLARREVLDLLAELRDAGMAILFVTHDRGAAEYLCDREVSLAPPPATVTASA